MNRDPDFCAGFVIDLFRRRRNVLPLLTEPVAESTSSRSSDDVAWPVTELVTEHIYNIWVAVAPGGTHTSVDRTSPD